MALSSIIGGGIEGFENRGGGSRLGAGTSQGRLSEGRAREGFQKEESSLKDGGS